MDGYLGKQDVKHKLVQKALVAFLKDLPEKNQRVYIYFFNDGLNYFWMIVCKMTHKLG